jgi:hypothetical protein
MGISTGNAEGVKASGGGSKMLTPGKQKIKVNSIEMRNPPYDPTAIEILLNCEGPDEGPDFEGFKVNNEDPNSPTYKGKVARIRSQKWAYNTHDQNGKELGQIQNIVNFLKSLTDAVGGEEWFKSVDGKYNTIAEMIEGVNASGILEGKYFTAVVACKEYMKNNGHVGNDLSLAYWTKEGKSFSADENEVFEFNPDKHWEKYATNEAPVQGFTASEASAVNTAAFSSDDDDVDI